MSAANDGGPAFPLGEYVVINGVPTTQPTNGMTLRDYFGAAALQGILSNDSSLAFSHAARDAYIYADAMLAERANQKEAQP